MRWEALAEHRVITVGRSSGNLINMDIGLAKAGFRSRWSYEVQHLSTSLGLAKAGLGVAALPKMSLSFGPTPLSRAARSSIR